jgi:hypothetical protein
MHKSIILIGAVAALGACGQSSENAAGNNSAANAASAETPRPAYCFFKDKETKDWAAKAGKDGNVVVTGKAYREDARYKAALGPSTVNGASAEIAPTVTINDTGFAAPDDWWAVSATIPNSQAVATVTVKCGDKTLATLTIPRTK